MSYGYGAPAPSMSHTDSSSSANRRVEASATTSEKKGCRKFKKGSLSRTNCLLKKKAKRQAKRRAEKEGCNRYKKGSLSRANCLMKKKTKRQAKSLKSCNKHKAGSSAWMLCLKKRKIQSSFAKKSVGLSQIMSPGGKLAAKRQAARRRAYLARGRGVGPAPQTFYSPYTPETTAAYATEVQGAVASEQAQSEQAQVGLEQAALAAEGLTPEFEESSVADIDEAYSDDDYEDEDDSMLLYAGIAAVAAGAYWFFRVRTK